MSRKDRHTRRKVSKNRVRQEIEHMTLHPFMDAAEARGWVMSGVSIDKHRDPMWASGKATCQVFGGEVWIGCDLKNIDREIKRRFRANPDLQRLPVGEVGTAVASGMVWNENRGNLAPEPCDFGSDLAPARASYPFFDRLPRSVMFRRLPKGLQAFFSAWMDRAKGLSVSPLKDSDGRWPLLGRATKVWWKQKSLDELAQMRDVRRIIDETRSQDSRLDLMTLLAMEEAEQGSLEPEFQAFPLRDYCQSHGVVMRLKEGKENKEGMVGLMEEYLFNLAFSCADTPQKQYEVARVFFPLLRDSTIQQVLPGEKEENEEENRTGQHSPPITLPGRHRVACRMFSDGESSSFPLDHCGVDEQTLCVLVDGSSAWGWQFSRGTGLGGMDEVVFAEPLPRGSMVTAEYVYSELRQPTTVQAGPLSFVRGNVVGLTPAAACRELGRPMSLSEFAQPEELPESLPTEISFSATLESVEEANGASFAALCDVIQVQQPAPIPVRCNIPGLEGIEGEIEGWEVSDDRRTMTVKMTPRGQEMMEQFTNPVGLSISSRAVGARKDDIFFEMTKEVAGVVERGLQILSRLGYEILGTQCDHPPIAEGVGFPGDHVVLFEDRLLGRWMAILAPQDSREEERATA